LAKIVPVHEHNRTSKTQFSE